MPSPFSPQKPATQPKLLAFVGHAKDSLKLSPSQVLKLTPKGVVDFEAEEIWMDAWDQLSGSSIALLYRDELYVGGGYFSRESSGLG